MTSLQCNSTGSGPGVFCGEVSAWLCQSEACQHRQVSCSCELYSHLQQYLFIQYILHIRTLCIITGHRFVTMHWKIGQNTVLVKNFFFFLHLNVSRYSDIELSKFYGGSFNRRYVLNCFNLHTFKYVFDKYIL